MKLLEILYMGDIKENQQVRFISFLYKKTGWIASVSEELAEELHKAVNKKFKRRKIYARFEDNVWTADLTEINSIKNHVSQVLKYHGKLKNAN